MRKVLIVGATSAMVRETARLFATDGASLCLAARNPERLAAVASDLRVRTGAPVHEVLMVGAETLHGLDPMLQQAIEKLDGLDAVLIAHGYLPDRRRCNEDPETLVRSLNVNALSVAWLLTRVAARFEQQRHGCLAVISSGSGERGRSGSYAYGMAKSMVTTHLQGLRARLFWSGVSVVTILPSFVDSPMTAYLPSSLRWVSPEHAGRRIYDAMRSGRDVVYIPGLWRWALLLVRNMPESLAKRSRAELRLLERLEREAARLPSSAHAPSDVIADRTRQER